MIVTCNIEKYSAAKKISTRMSAVSVCFVILVLHFINFNSSQFKVTCCL